MNPYWIALTGGLLAFAHCMGMCGPLAVHVSQGGRRAALARQLLWHAGRISTYVFLGALAGFAGDRLTAAIQSPVVPKALAFAAGTVMILMGLAMLGLLPWRMGKSAVAPAGPDAASPTFIQGLFGQFFTHPSPAAAFVLGLGTGLLPCPIVWGFLAMAVHERSVPSGMLIMAAMGAGTVWSLLALGLTGQALRMRLRKWAAPLAGCVVIAMGAATMLRGTDAFHGILGCHTGEACSHSAASPASQPARDCCGNDPGRP